MSAAGDSDVNERGEPWPVVLQRTLDDAADKEREGDLDAALAVLDGSPQPLRAFGTFHYARGALAVRRGNVDDGILSLERALELEPEVPEMKGNLGAAFLERVQRRGQARVSDDDSQADLARALELLDEAARGKPRIAEVHANHGLALTLAGRPYEALMAFDRALALDAVHRAALYNKAAALHGLGREEEALACLDALLAVHPGFEPALHSRASTLERLGRS